MGSWLAFQRVEVDIPIHPISRPVQAPESGLMFACQFNKSGRIVHCKADSLTSDAGIIPIGLVKL